MTQCKTYTKPSINRTIYVCVRCALFFVYIMDSMDSCHPFTVIPQGYFTGTGKMVIVVNQPENIACFTCGFSFNSKTPTVALVQ